MPDQVDFESMRPSLRQDVEIRHYGTEAIAASDDGRAIALDTFAALAVQLIDGEVELGSLISEVHQVVGLPAAVARRQLHRVVSSLDAAGFLTLAGVETGSSNEADLYYGPPNP